MLAGCTQLGLLGPDLAGVGAAVAGGELDRTEAGDYLV